MKFNKLLPIGSIVTVEDIPNEIMISGYMGLANDENTTESRDYIGVDAINGYDDQRIVLFNKESIENVLFMGYKDEETIKKIKIIDIVNEECKRSRTAEEAEALITFYGMNAKSNTKIASNTKSLLEEKDLKL